MSLFNRILSLVLSISMLLGMVPPIQPVAFAAELTTDDGIVYTVDESAGTATVTGYDGLETDLVIPEQLGGYPVRKIGSSAFASSGLTSLALPEGLKTIGGSILDGNTGVKELTIPASVTAMSTSSQGALRNSGVTTLTFAAGMTKVPGYAAQYATELTQVNLPESVTAIGGSAFEGCTALESILLPGGLTAINSGAFKRCTAMESIQLPAGLTEIGSSVFAYSGLTSLALPEGLKTVGGSILDGNTGVKELTIPASVTAMSTSSQGALRNSGVTTLTFAAGMTKVPGYAAQYATELTQVNLPESVTTIGGSAFEGCTALAALAIPKTVTAINSGAFEGTPNLTLYCPYHSYATLYAIENSIPYKPAGVFVDSEEYALRYADSRYYADVKAISAKGYVSMTVEYAIKDAWKDRATDRTVHIFLPEGAELDEMTLKLDGELCTRYSLNGRNLKIPVESDSGTFRFAIRMNQQKGLVSYAAMSMEKDGVQAKEVIGILNDAVNVLTLHAPEVTASKEVPVSGLAPVSAQVTLSVNGQAVQTVTASKAGSWSASVVLPSPVDYHSYTLTASCADGDEAMAQSVAVTYHEGEPSITGFAMTRGNQRWELTGSTTRPNVVFNSKRLDFEVTFDDPEQIRQVYVTSTRNQEVKYLEAVYDAEKDAFVTAGYFDPDNRNYVPGVLSIEYTKKVDPAPVSKEFDWSIFDEQLPSQGESAVTVLEDRESGFATRIDMGSVCSGLQDVFVDASVSVYDAKTDGDLADWLGVFGDMDTVASYIIPGVDDEKYIAALDTSDPYTYVMLVQDVTGSEFVKFTLKSAAQGTDDMEKLMKLGEISTTVSAVNTVAGVLLKRHEIETDMRALRDEVLRRPFASDEELDAALGKVDELEQDQTEFMLMTTVLPLMVKTITASSAPVIGSTVTMAAAPVLMTAMIGVFVVMAPVFWEMRTAQIKGEDYRINFAIDPSGYVYDISTGDRLEGVKTTAYYIAYDESEDFWDRMPAAEEYGKRWNAQEYDQANPLYTDEDGRYAWDVPEGWWRVSYEKDGYETVWSQWLPVPPPQTQVNIGMTPVGYVPPTQPEETEPEETEPKETEPEETEPKETEPEETEPTQPVYENPFEDVFETDYYYDPVLWAVANGITNGMDATHFTPGGTCTRAQIVTFLWRSCGSPAPAVESNPFADVSADAWYADAVLWAVGEGITTGTSATTFSPDSGCTRGQVATFLWRSQGRPAVSAENIFTDIAQGAYYYDAVLWAVANNITNGMGDGLFAPDATCTRGQIVTFLYRAMA